MKKETQNIFGTRKNKITTVAVLFMCLIFSSNSFGQNLLSQIAENWVDGNWKNYYRSLYAYDNNNHLINYQNQTWDVSSNTWKNFIQDIYVNNSNGTVNNSIRQDWSSGTNAWNNQFRYVHSYNSAGAELMKVVEAWTNGNWQTSGRLLSTYDNNNYMTHYLYQTWETGTNSWQNFFQYNYVNNANGTINNYTQQNWDITLNAWKNTLRMTHTYDVAGNLQTIVTEAWANDSWQNSYKQVYVYDGNNYVINYQFQIWDVSSNTWKNSSQINYSLNPDETYSHYIYQMWDNETNAWKNYQRVTYTYGSTLGIDNFNYRKDFTVYPNPATNNITIKSEDNNGAVYCIIDQLGRQVLNGRLNGSETVVDIDQLSKGAYFIQMGQEKPQTIKIIKQ
ncbi:hypothetical protein FEDK69T_11410 [Flavobacterium enshiense DK69]|uniref:Secretion system C-terminal sorting domain-containing protein n=2 Tax=Flavobacterium TaxID=237 RepID=V6SAU1_9FLAO|nr:hypothetical protein FEDK69T_11410 [Flavobacterium enshiense DK69]KGO96136.1 hypothetical protein Q767_07710 [Flavobacterium enshiense DK69]